MSGSYDRPSGRRSTVPSAPGLDPFEDILTGPPTGAAEADRYYYGTPPDTQTPPPPQRREVRAPARAKRPPRKQTSTPVVPPDSVTGRSLTLVISIMCFLACLTAGAFVGRLGVPRNGSHANAWGLGLSRGNGLPSLAPRPV